MFQPLSFNTCTNVIDTGNFIAPDRKRSQYLSNNYKSFNTEFKGNFTFADDRSNILAWLSPLDSKSRHREIQDRRVEDIGRWLLQTEEFTSWYAGSGGSEFDNPVLFCYGDPGAGKTYISSLVIDDLCDHARERNTTVAGFYCDFAVRKEQTSTNMLGALLRHLVCGLEQIPEEISRAYQDQKSSLGGRGPRLSDLAKMLQIIASKKHTFICIDALDECMEEDRVKLLDSLNKILRNSPGTRIFVTGRPHILPEVGRRLAGRVTSVSIGPKKDDIITYLQARLDWDTIPDAMDSGLEADILRKIPEDISETFLLVSLIADAILQETTIHRRRQKLSAITVGLGLEDAYGATLGRIRGQGGEKARLGMTALMWISHAERPLKANELCHALAVEIGSPNLNTDNVPSIGTLLICCQGLVIVDGEASTVRLIHFTLQEYLRAHTEPFVTAHSMMAETCLSYLNSHQVKGLSARPPPNLQHTPFLEYSSLYWGIHARRDLSGRTKFLALELFGGYDNHISTKILLRAQKWCLYANICHNLSLFNGLHCASIFGIVEIVACLVKVEGCDINQKDCVGNTPLVWAALNGHEGVVEILLQRDGVDPNLPNKCCQTPLWCAAQNGHEGVVKRLLERSDVNPDKPDKYRQTPLWCAAQNGHEGVVETLLRRSDVKPDRPDNHGRTPLCCAARNGHEGVVKRLLGQNDVNPNTPDNRGQTPLCCAARNGHEKVVKRLLERGDVKPDRPDNCGQTPLCYAAGNGHDRVVERLLGQGGVSPDRPDNHGQTPLCCAARNGHEEVVRRLLGQGDVNPDTPDNRGQTPLCYAARNGHEGVVKILLGRGDAKPDKPDEDGQTPLSHAARNGREGVVRILLGRGEVNPDKPDEDGRTPILHAAGSGHTGIVKILLGRDDVNPSKPDEDGQTPVSCAARNGHQGVVEILQGRHDVNPTSGTN